MDRVYNEMIFDVQETNGKENAFKFIQNLIEMNANPDSRLYNDIHINQEENSIIVEWVQVPYSGEWGGTFQFVDEDQKIVTEKILPDNSIVYVENENEYKEYLLEFLKNNPQWKMNVLGKWYEVDNDESTK